MRTWRLFLVISVLMASASAFAGAELLGARETTGVFPALNIGAMFQPEGTTAFDGGVTMLFEPFKGRGLLVGPRVGVLVGEGTQGTRFDLNSGLEGAIWLGNVLAPGLAIDLVAPGKLAGQSLDPRVRLESFLAFRFNRLGDDGAVSIRAGVAYDTRFRWGGRLGLTLQFSGVANLGASVN